MPSWPQFGDGAMNLLDIYKELNTEAKCLAFLEHMRWPEGVKCLSCESLRITRITAKGKLNKKSGKRSHDRELYQCNECRFQFTATTGTVYHDTHLPLCKWFLAIALITESKKESPPINSPVLWACSTGPRGIWRTASARRWWTRTAPS